MFNKYIRVLAFVFRNRHNYFLLSETCQGTKITSNKTITCQLQKKNAINPSDYFFHGCTLRLFSRCRTEQTTCSNRFMSRRAWRAEPMTPSLQPASTSPAGRKACPEHLKVRKAARSEMHYRSGSVCFNLFLKLDIFCIEKNATARHRPKIKKNTVLKLQFSLPPPLFSSSSSHRNLRRLSHLQEGDWPVFQADPEGPGDQRGPHHHRGLHVPLLLQPGPAQAGADGGHLHCQESRGAGPGARQEPHLSGRSRHLHGLAGLCREEDSERWVVGLVQWPALIRSGRLTLRWMPR